jgi:hypothetical protein
LTKEENIMELKRRTTAYIALTLILLAFSPTVRAATVHSAHATNFLDALYESVTNRLDTDTNLSAAEERALSNAARTLERKTTTLPADLLALSAAATQLDGSFSEDATFSELEDDALADYSATARARLDEVYLWIGTNTVTKGLNNQVQKAESALDRAGGLSNGVPAQARSLASAFNKILSVEKKVRKQFDAPGPTTPPITPPPPPPPGTNSTPDYVPPAAVAPGTPGLASDTFGTKHVDLYENDVVNDQTVFYFSTAQSGAQIYNVHHPEELGLWTYVRTAANEGVIVVDPDYPDNAPRRPLFLTFTSATGGTFTGTTYFGQAVTGTFAVIQ